MKNERKPAANEEKGSGERAFEKGACEKPQAPSNDSQESSDSRLTMTFQEAELIAQNLKESGARR
ncbi:MAG: hypothetical protein U9R72_01280 [Chloroflexota bacterium]|nr:hypothetical protein [Chloroflexota bacterium]